MSPKYLLLPLAILGLSSAALRADDDEDWPRRWHRHSRTQAEAHVNAPLKDLKTALDGRSGAGLGLQWLKRRSGGHESRTRLEWNVFPEGHPVGIAGVKTQVSNYTLSWDHLYHFSGTQKGPYIFGGAGAIRWFVDETTPAASRSFHTTKLGVSAGIGLPLGDHFGAELRYVVSSYQRNLDANTLQAGISWHF